MMSWRRLWKYDAWRQLPPNILLLKRLLLPLNARAASLRQPWVIIWVCLSSECDSSDSPDPPLCCDSLLRRATGALTALPMPFRSFVATVAFSASLTPQLSSNRSLGICFLRANEVTCLPSMWWDMEFFHTHFTLVQGCKISTGTLVKHDVCTSRWRALRRRFQA